MQCVQTPCHERTFFMNKDFRMELATRKPSPSSLLSVGSRLRFTPLGMTGQGTLDGNVCAA